MTRILNVLIVVYLTINTIILNGDFVYTTRFDELSKGQMLLDLNQMATYFETSYKFGSLFIISDKNNERRIVSEIKQVNDGQAQVSFIPLSEEESFQFENGEEIVLINEANNISFKSRVLALHNKSWITMPFPHEVKIVNLRTSERAELRDEHLSGLSKIISFGEEGIKPLMNHEGRVLDISESGMAFEIKGSAISGYYKGDQVELMITEKFPFLTQVKGKVVHKMIGNMMNKEERFYRIGIKFNKKLKLSPLDLF